MVGEGDVPSVVTGHGDRNPSDILGVRDVHFFFLFYPPDPVVGVERVVNVS